MHLFWHRLITVCYAGATILLRYFYCKKAIRIISGGNTKSHTEPIFKLYNLLKIADIYKSKLLILYYKILKFSSPRYRLSISNSKSINQGWGQVQLTKYSSTPSTPNIYQVQVLVKYSFF